MPDSCVTQKLSSLPSLTKAALHDLWRRLFKGDPLPEIRKDLMLQIVAYRLQEQELGGLNDAYCRRLRRLAQEFEAHPKATLSSRPPIKAGTRLVRQWKEEVHVVNVESKSYEYKGTHYENLSQIARLITGTRWSGPLFFGVKVKQPNKSLEVLQ
jgi:hypothetical protein